MGNPMITDDGYRHMGLRFEYMLHIWNRIMRVLDFELAIDNKDIKRIHEILDSNKNFLDPFLDCVCKKGRLDLVYNIMIYGKINVEGGLVAACDGGHKEIVELMISLGANNFDGCIERACAFKKIEIVEMMLNHGAKTRRNEVCENLHKINRKNLFNIMKISVIDDIKSVIYLFLKFPCEEIPKNYILRF